MALQMWALTFHEAALEPSMKSCAGMMRTRCTSTPANAIHRAGQARQRDWSHIGVLTINPERDSIDTEHLRS